MSFSNMLSFHLFLSIQRVQQQFPNSMGVHSQFRQESFPGMRCTVRGQMPDREEMEKAPHGAGASRRRSQGSNEAIIYRKEREKEACGNQTEAASIQSGFRINSYL